MSVNELEAAGITRMDEAEIAGFLSSQGVGVLGLPDEPVPYMIPMSFGFDGEDALYFTYFTGAESRKRTLTERAETARFLVYKATSQFSWQSVQVAGPIERVPESERADVEAVMDNAWHPDVFDPNGLNDGVAVYRLRIETRVGMKQNALPPRFRSGATGSESEE